MRRESSPFVWGFSLPADSQAFRVRILSIIGTCGGSARKLHLLAAVETGDVDGTRGADTHAAAGANVFARAGRLARGRRLRSAVGPDAGNLKGTEFVAVDQDIRQAVFQNEIQQAF